jgi:hypothetical protein
MRVITFTGFKPDNFLKQKGVLNIWVDSKAYNIVEILTRSVAVDGL